MERRCTIYVLPLRYIAYRFIMSAFLLFMFMNSALQISERLICNES